MGLSQTILGEQDRKKLDGIISQMQANSESEEDIRFVVEDFKNKYSVKKKEPSTASKLGSQVGALASAPQSTSKEIQDNDPVKSILHPLRNKYSEAQKQFDPLRNNEFFRSGESTVQRGVLPKEILNQKWEDFTNKQNTEKRSLVELSATQEEIHKQFDNVKNAKQVLSAIKKKNGGVVPKDNETGQLAQQSVDSYGELSKSIANSKDFSEAAINEELKNDPEFAKNYKQLNGKLPRSYEGRIVANWLQRHEENIWNFLEDHPYPQYKSQISKYFFDFEKHYPETTAAQIGSEVSRAYEKQSGAFADLDTKTFNNKVDQLAAELYKDNPKKLEQYNTLVKDHKKEYFRSAAALNEFGAGVIGGLHESVNTIKDVAHIRGSNERLYEQLDEQGKHVSANPKGIREFISTSSGFMGTIAQMGATGGVLKGVGVPGAIASKIPVFTTFYDEQLKQAEGRFGANWKSKLSAALTTSLFALAPDVVPTNKMSAAFDNILKDVSEKASVSSVRARLTNAVSETLIQYGKGVGEMTGITAAGQIVDAALGSPHENADEELYQTFRSMAMGNVAPALIHGVGKYSSMKPEQKIELQSAIDELPEGTYTSALKTATKEELDTYLKNIAEQLNSSESEASTTRKVFGEKISDIALELYPDARVEPTTTELPITEEANTEVEQPPVGEANTNIVETEKGSERLQKSIVDAEELYGRKESKGALQDREDAKALIKNRTTEKFDITSKERLAKDLGLPVTYFDDVSFKEWSEINPANIKGEIVSGNEYKDAFNDLKEKYKSDIDAYKKVKQQKFATFKERLLSDHEAVTDSKFDFIISSDLDQNGRQQAIKNIREGKDTKAAQTLLSEIQKMYDEGYVYLNRGRGNAAERIQIPVNDYFKVHEETKVEPTYESLEEINTLLGEDSFNENFDKIFEHETQRPTEIRETPTVDTGAATQGIEQAKDTQSQPSSNESIPEPTIGSGEPPKPPTGEAIGDDEGVGIAHAATEEVRKKHGLGDYERNNATDAQLEAIADEAIKKGYDPEVLISQMEKGIPPTGAENFILKKYLATLESKVETNHSDENIAAVERLVKATDKIGSLQSEAFRTRRGIVPVDDSLVGFFITEKQANKDAPLTEQQKETVKKEYEDISSAQKAYEEKIEKLEAENSRLKAEKEIKKSKPQGKKERKTHEDFVKERSQIVENIKEKLRKARGEMDVTVVPYAKELIAIAPDVAKLTKSLIEEGVTNLADIVDNIHSVLKESIPTIAKKDVHDIIAGEYNEKRPPRKDLAQKLFDLRTQAQLINKLERLQAGEQPKTERQRVKRNQEIEDLRKQIKELQEEQKRQEKEQAPSDARTSEQKTLDALKKRIQKEISKIESDLKEGNFSKEEKKLPIQLDSEAVRLKDKLVKLKTEREVRLMKQRYENRDRFEKTRDWLIDKLNVPRTIMASMDYSAPLRQGLVAGIAHPRTAAKASIEMFKASFSQRNFDRWMYDNRESPRYDIMQKSGLAVTDPHSPFLAAKEEAFMNNTAEKIPLIGKLIKGSERAYVMFLNKMRVDLFNRFADRFEDAGKTYENSPELYKATANLINAETGRGHLGALENAAPILNTVFFSPRLIASRVNLLTNWANPNFYRKVPKEVRIMYFKDMIKFIGLGTSILALAKLNGSDVEDDPRSSDFGKIKSGNTRWDIWGGHQQYVRLITQLATAEKKSTNTGEIQELDSKGRFGEGRGDVVGRFIRGKLAPVPSMAVDFFKGRTVSGEDVALGSEAESHLLPLIYSDIKDAMKDKGVESIFTVGVPAIFGVGVQTYDQKDKEIPKSIEHNGKRIELTERQYADFKKISKSKINSFSEKLKSLPEYKKIDNAEDKRKLETIATNQAIKAAAEEIKKKYSESFKKETHLERGERLKKQHDLEKIKRKITQ